ncbi:MAG: F420-dependent oxidoreductase, family [Ilumatobacteraceae bacterium]|nr:F420-dependent oxidoreductase, family [Ilumatobacteraceae bacterium]
MKIGYTLMTEEHGPVELVEIARQSEALGFDFLVQSDHFHPWVPEQRHSPNAWALMGAVAASTTTIGLQTFVTCPILRYHPAIVAQQAATVALLSAERFTLSVGAGERLNEHVVGRGWPPVEVRHRMLREALEIITTLWTGGYHSYHGTYFDLEDAQVFDLPDRHVPLAMAISGDESLALAIDYADHIIATTPEPDLISAFRAAKGAMATATTQLAVSYGANADDALRIAHRQFRWASLGWKVQAELPNPVNFDAASKFVRPEDLTQTVPHGPDVDQYVNAIRASRDAGFDRVALVQVGDAQQQFFDFWSSQLRDALLAEGLFDAP